MSLKRASTGRRLHLGSRLALGLGLSLAVMLTGCGGPPGESSDEGQAATARASLILMTVDTLRGDHFLAEVGGQALTPNLAVIAEESVVFSSAASVACATTAGVAGIFTGLVPRRSGVVVNDNKLPQDLPTIASLLRDAGYRTGAFVANPVIGPGHGFERGFETYQLLKPQRPRRKARAEVVNAAALAWLDSLTGDEPFFLWLHYMEPHGPYEPTEEALAHIPEQAFTGASTEVDLLPKGNNSGLAGIPFYQQYGQAEPSSDAAFYLRAYAAEVWAMDLQAGHMVQELRQRGLWQDSIFVFSADHGEALDDNHGYFFSHGNGLTQDQVGVPLMLRYPGLVGGEQQQAPVSTVDILPTIAELLRLPTVEADGLSLLQQGQRDVLSQFWREYSLRRGPWKLRVTRTGEVSLVDLDSDPGELRDLRELEPERFSELRRRLGEIKQRPPLAEPLPRDELREEQRRSLEALGYL